jgi:hypothetical protein
MNGALSIALAGMDVFENITSELLRLQVQEIRFVQDFF